ncbi:hypothetical protein KPH14_011464 [Odynerus spinipes]|uniref:Breast cancer type 2 susceptibility protein n=1 Tax=Odynerus spinipes TaxID=1348599 RepID=A0AAD9RVF3_9HYME|nr:hypothetical protein KPH14_011464 [Odynerus spinipes]
MDINKEECTNFTPIKNCEESGKQNKINGYISEDTNSNCSADSNELFSDDENDDVIYYTPNVSRSTDPSFLNISETSLLHTNKQAQINEQWTADLETPQAKKNDQIQAYMDKSLQSSVEKSVSASKQFTPNTSYFKNQFNEATSTSPVINCTRVRRRTKRRIFKTTSIAIDTAIDPAHCENVITLNIQDKHEEAQLRVPNKNNDGIEQVHVSKSQDTSPTDNNTSTQDFFCNASFANIDQICANFAGKNDTCNTENNNERKLIKDVSEDNIRQDLNECDEKKNSDCNSKVTSVSNIGFSTASGKHIYVSDSAISNAKSLLEADDTSSTNIPLVNKKDVTLPKSNKEFVKVLPVKNTDNSASVSFTTAKGQLIKPSEKALEKARALFADQMNDIPGEITKLSIENTKDLIKNSFLPEKKCNVNKVMTSHSERNKTKVTLNDKVVLRDRANIPVNNMEIKKQLPSSSFATAGGRSLSISDKALSKAKKMLVEQLEDNIQINKNMLNSNHLMQTEVCVSDQINKPIETTQSLKSTDSNLKGPPIQPAIVSNIGFSTAAGRKVSVSKEALSKAEMLLSDDISDVGKSNNLLDKPINKRKSLHVCDGTLDQLSSLNAKKVRLSNKSTTTEKENNTLSENTGITQSNNTFTNEIMASTAALLEDEEDIDQNIKWVSKGENCEPKKNNKTPSPVIGRQLVPRKRGKKRSLQFNEKQDVMPSNKSNINTDMNKQSCVFNNICVKEPAVKNVEDMLQKRLEAVSQQEKIIRDKRFNRPKATAGTLLSYKEENRNARLSWKKLVGNDVPHLCSLKELINRDTSSEILSITAATALSYKFQCSHFYGEEIIQEHPGGLKMEDGGYLIPDEDDCAGVLEIKQSFLASPGVDPSLLPTGWVENHYKWIVWKLASMDRIKFNSISLPRALTPTNVMLQLKYRYDREIDRLQRPCLRRILEKDDSASQRMILCVSTIVRSTDIENNEQSPKMSGINHWKMLLTDGWYSIPASIDAAMMSYIVSGKVHEGTKLITFGAELLNLDQGCPPLEIPNDVSLKIHTNSTRRVRWDTKLGYAPHPGPMLIRLQNVSPYGGLIGKIKVVVTRTYPMLYHEKNILGESVFRNSRCEEKANVAYEEECRSRIEAFYAEAEKKFEKKISNEQHEAEKFMQKLESKLRESLPPPRQVTPVFKVRVSEEDTSAILTIWAPSEDIVDILKEGTCITIRSVFASGKRAGDLQLTASRSTSFNKENMCKDFPKSRVYTPLQSVTESSFNPLYGEFDTVGIVSSVVTSPYGMKNFEAVNIAYPHENIQEGASGSSYLSILFWEGVSTFGYAEILTVGSLVACSNLEWRRCTSWNIPVAYCTDRTVFVRNPRQNHLCQAFERLKDLIKMPYAAYAAKCAEEISLEIQKKTSLRIPSYGTPDKSTPDKFKTDSSKSTGSGSRLDVRNVNSNSIKSAAIQRRLEKLHYYSNPPELSPLVLKNSSSRVSLDFRSPIRNDTLKPTKLNMDP